MNGRWRSLKSIAGVVVFLTAQSLSAHAAMAPSLGNAESFAILGATAVSNTGTSVITGDLGIAPNLASSVTGFPPGIVTGGSIYAGAVIPDPVAAAAQLDAGAAFTALDQPCTTTFIAPTDLGGMTLTPGVYCFGSTAGLTGTLTLNGGGNAAAVWIFKIGSSLTTATDSLVRVINGGQNCNVFWRITDSATLGTRTTFVGTIIANTSISLTTNASIAGRALALTGAVTLDTNNLFATVCSATTPAVAPTLGKTFVPATINAGDVSTLTITLSNPNTSAAALTAPLVDTLPAGVTIAAVPNASTTCSGSGAVGAIAAGSTVTLPTTRSIPAGSSTTPGTCTVTVDVTAAAAGVYLNTLAAGALQTSNGTNLAPAIATLTVVPLVPPGGPPTLGKAFGPSNIIAGVTHVSTLTLTLSNPSASPAILTAPLTDTLPAGTVIAATPNAATTCLGATCAVIAPAGGTAVTLPATTCSIPASSGGIAGTCTVTVDVTAPLAGSFLNTLAADTLQTDQGNNVAPVVATLTVTSPIVLPPAPSPTLSGWALIMATVLLALVGLAAVRRRAA